LVLDKDGKMIPNTAQELIAKFMGDGMSREEAINRAMGFHNTTIDPDAKNRIINLADWRYQKQLADKKSMEF